MDNQLALFDYEQLDTETQATVKQETDELKAIVKRSAQDIITIGQKLIRVKEALPHGEFGKWLEAEFGWGWTTATKFMNITMTFSHCENLPTQSLSALALLAAPSTPDEARTEILQRAENGETILYTQVKETVDSYKQPIQDVPEYVPSWIDGNSTDDDNLDEALEDEHRPVCSKCGLVYDGDNCPDCNKPPMAHVGYNTGNNEWYTPIEYIQAANNVMGDIDLDPASTEIANTIVKARAFYTKDTNGLIQEWSGRVWMNPPYASDLIGKFIIKLTDSIRAEKVTEAIVLVNNATETAWFKELASIATAICFPVGRVKFWSPDRIAAPLQGQAVVYFGPKVNIFRERFKVFGWTATL